MGDWPRRLVVTAGAGLLRDFLAKHGLSQRAAGAALYVEGPTIHDWVHCKKRPSARHRAAIEVWTGGEVPASSWVSEEDNEIVRDVKPFAPPAKSSSTQACSEAANDDDDDPASTATGTS